MSNYDFDIGILGGGSGGLTVAAGAAKLGAKTLLIDRESRLSGDCLHYGCVPSKTLIMTSRVRHLMKRAGHFGLREPALACEFQRCGKENSACHRHYPKA